MTQKHSFRLRLLAELLLGLMVVTSLGSALHFRTKLSSIESKAVEQAIESERMLSEKLQLEKEISRLNEVNENLDLSATTFKVQLDNVQSVLKQKEEALKRCSEGGSRRRSMASTGKPSSHLPEVANMKSGSVGF